MIGSIINNVINAFYGSDTQKSGYAKAIEVLSQAVNLENGIGESSSLSTQERKEILSKDKSLCYSLKGYRKLKDYIQGKLERLKELGPQGTGRMTTMLRKNREGIIYKDHLGYGFSDEVYYSPLKEGEALFPGPLGGRLLYILTPVDSPFINNGVFYDVSRMYQVPSNLHDV